MKTCTAHSTHPGRNSAKMFERSQQAPHGLGLAASPRETTLADFKDHRSEALAQRTVRERVDSSPQVQSAIVYQEMAEHSPQTYQALQFQAAADASPGEQTQAQFQAKVDNSQRMVVQRATMARVFDGGIPKTATTTGMPDTLQSGIEALSGMDMSDVRVHYNSSKPATLQALAYTHAPDIYVGPGQEQYLPHEAWHAVQQAQGRVKPTMHVRGVRVNDDPVLEHEADAKGAHALRTTHGQRATHVQASHPPTSAVVQMVPLGIRSDTEELNTDNLPAIQTYVRHNLEQGRKDLVNILLERVKRLDREHFSALEQFSIDNAHVYVPPATTLVPNTIHLIWMGNRISPNAVENIQNSYKNLGAHSQLILWTDSRKRTFLNTSEAKPLRDLERTMDVRFSVRNVDDSIDARIQKTYALAVERNAYSMASDLARYSILLKHGGIYMDVDLAAPGINLEGLHLPTHGLPILGPNIRDVANRDQILPTGLNELEVRGEFQRAHTPAALNANVSGIMHHAFRSLLHVAAPPLPEAELSPENVRTTIGSHNTLESMEKTRVTAMAQYLLGRFSNQFIAAPANHRFIDSLIGQISANLEKRTNWDKDQVASLTGPSFFSSAIATFYKTQDRIYDLDTIERRYMLDPQQVARVVDIHWLTRESENQIGKPQATEGYATSTKVIAASAIAIGIGAIAAWYFLSKKG